MSLKKEYTFILPLFVGVSMGCNSSGNANDLSLKGINGASSEVGSESSAPASEMSNSTGSVDQGTVKGVSCQSNDSSHLCLALKYVAYKSSSNQNTVSQEDAIKNIQSINKLWNKCKIAFQLENYVAITPKDYGLQYRPANDGELSGIREDFVDKSTLLIVTTGTWDRSGSLGNSGANAWTSMPGDTTYGVVLEKTVGTFSNIIAHEIGHYLNLLHVDDTSDLMNPIIYDYSTHLTNDQCATARSAVSSYWQKMMR